MACGSVRDDEKENRLRQDGIHFNDDLSNIVSRGDEEQSPKSLNFKTDLSLRQPQEKEQIIKTTSI